MSANNDNKYFCDGITDAIINHLFRINDLAVHSRTSVESYRENPLPIPKIAKKLSVNYILEGSVQRGWNLLFST